MTDIYAYHVLHGTGSFEETPPVHQVMLERWEKREGSRCPTLIAELNGNTVGFAYAGTYKSRAAYRYTVEDSIYVSHEAVGLGVGSVLLDRLMQLCGELGYQQMIAVIGDSANTRSIRLHEKAGFELIGVARAIGFKHDRWLDVVYMQRSLVERRS